LKLISYPHTFR